MTIDKKTNLVKKTIADIILSIDAGESKQKLSEQVSCTYDYSTGFNIEVPDTLK